MGKTARFNGRQSPQDAALAASFQAIRRAAGAAPGSDVLAAKARGLMIGYHGRWANSGWRAAVVEPPFHLPIINPASGRRSRTFSLAGRCEAVVVRQGDGRRFLLQSRTVGEDLAAVDTPFWRRLAVDGQAALYALAQGERGDPVAGVLYDVLRRPQLRPRAVPKGAANRAVRQNVGTRCELEERKTYFGWPVDERQRRAVVKGDGRETPQLYSMRIAADALRRPGWYFRRRIVRASQKHSLRHVEELWQAAVEMRLALRAGRHYRNSQACMAYHTPCPYLPICCGRDTPQSERWRPVRSIHPELADVLKGVDKRSVLTHSRLQCFKLCRRKHYYRYELGIVPAKQTGAEALRFGQVIRRALVTWWRNLGPTQ